MKGCLFCLVFFCSLLGDAQDKIYLLNGTKLEGKVVTISSENITYRIDSSNRFLNVRHILLIEFSNGKTEVFANNQNKHLKAETNTRNQQPTPPKFNLQNECYLNTLALFNADVSMHYEYKLKNQKTGIGFLGTYNFNRYAGVPNAFIALMSNGKKIYDAGVFINFYTGNTQSRLKFYYGLQFKYTAFNFSAADLDSVYYNSQLTVNVSYAPSSSSQFSSLFTLGLHTDLNETLFMKYSFALGFFVLNEHYKQQLGYRLSDPQTGAYPSISVLPKSNLGISIGVKF